MNPDSCPEIPLTFPRPVKAWETSDHRLFAHLQHDVAQEHEAKLKKAADEKQLLRDFASSRLDLNAPRWADQMARLRSWLKANPELVERLVNS